jgi:hypothetical protein
MIPLVLPFNPIIPQVVFSHAVATLRNETDPKND